VVYRGLCALGTALPLLTVLGLLSVGGGSMRGCAQRVGRGQRLAAVLSGLGLIVVGHHDTFVYWLL
jgi:hypothetical protein